MVYRISVEAKFLRAELFDRNTMEETQEFLQIVVRESMMHLRSCILIHIHSSAPILIFPVEHHGFVESFKELVRTPRHCIALLGDTRELRRAHKHIELLARQHGLNVRSFGDEADALRWFGGRRQQPDRRQRQERREHEERRRQRDRRQQASSTDTHAA